MSELDLINAAKESDIEKIKELIKQDIDINTCDSRGYTAMLWAAQKGNIDIVNLLIKNGANIEAKHEASRGYTPLIVAAINNHIEVAKMLIEHGANINSKNNNGNTALSVANEKGHTEIVELLEQTNIYTEKALLEAAKNGNFKTVKLLINKGVNINAKYNNGWVSNYNIAKNNNGMTALMWASNNGHTEIAKMLIDAGADVNAKDNDGDTALMRASEKGHTEVAKLLINAGATE